MVLRHWYVLRNESNYFTNRYTYRYSRLGKLNHSLGIQSISLSIIILKRKTKDKPMKVNLIITHSFIQEKIAAPSKMSPKQSLKSEQVASTFRLQPLYVTCNHDYALFIILVSLFFQLLSLIMNPC